MLLLAALLLAPAELPRGQIIERVEARADAAHSYALYLPSGYTAERRWPMLYCFDPGARGALAVRRFASAAERYGWIVAGSNDSRNGPWAPVVAAYQAMWDDTHARFEIDARRVYAAGLSGGARAAAALAQFQFAGVIGCGASFPGPAPKAPAYAWLGAAGRDDFNYDEVRQAHETLLAAGAVSRFLAFDGAHAWPPESVCTAAVEWMELQAMKTSRRPADQGLTDRLLQMRLEATRAAAPGEAYFEYAALASDFGGLADVTAFEQEAARRKSSREPKRFRRQENELMERARALRGQLEAAVQERDAARLTDLIRTLGKQASTPADSAGRRLARRVLSGEYVARIYENGGDAEFRKRELELLRPALGWWLRN